MRNEKEYMDMARRYKEIMGGRRRKPKGSLKDIVLLIKAMESNDFNLVRDTRLFNLHTGEYCEYQQIISKYGIV